MKKLKILIAIIIFSSYNFSSFAKEKDCSTIDTSTGVGMLEKFKCEKTFEKSKNTFKSKIKKIFKNKN